MSIPNLRVIILATVIAIAIASSGIVAQTPAPKRADPIKEGEVPQRKKIAPIPKRGTFVPPKTPWGDPDITGDYNNSDESGIPFERPDEYAGRAHRLLHAGRAREDGRAAAAADHRAHSGAERVPGCDEPDALVRELLRGQQPPMARDRSGRWQSAGADGGSTPAAGAHDRPRERVAARPIHGKTAASTIAASRAAFPDR